MGWSINTLEKSATSKEELVSEDIPEMTKLKKVKVLSL